MTDMSHGCPPYFMDQINILTFYVLPVFFQEHRKHLCTFCPCSFSLWIQTEGAVTVWLAAYHTGIHRPLHISFLPSAYLLLIRKAVQRGSSSHIVTPDGSIFIQHFGYLLPGNICFYSIASVIEAIYNSLCIGPYDCTAVVLTILYICKFIPECYRRLSCHTIEQDRQKQSGHRCCNPAKLFPHNSLPPLT